MSDSPNSPEALAKRFQMDHLIPKTTEAAKEEVEKAVGSTQDPAAPDPKDPRFQKQYSFTFEYRDSRGKLWVGDFTNQILNLRMKSMVGVMRAKMAGGLPADSLDPLTAELNLMVSHLAYSLTTAPDWAKDLLSLDDQELVGQLFDRVMDHEAFFRSGRPAPTAGQGGGK